MPAARKPIYDSELFRQIWFSPIPLREIAARLGVTPPAVIKAARRRNLPMPRTWYANG